jgi:dsDNA-binding SOS-regulon protein
MIQWILNNGYVVDSQTGDVICLMSKNEDQLRDKMVELAPEMFNTIISFVEQIESGKFAARSTYNEFKQILKRVPKELYESSMQIQ